MVDRKPRRPRVIWTWLRRVLEIELTAVAGGQVSPAAAKGVADRVVAALLADAADRHRRWIGVPADAR